MRTSRGVEPTRVTRAAGVALLIVIAATATLLLIAYPSLPDLLPVHFSRRGVADGWQYRTLARVLIPVGVQVMLAMLLGTVAALLLSRQTFVPRQRRRRPLVCWP